MSSYLQNITIPRLLHRPVGAWGRGARFKLKGEFHGFDQLVLGYSRKDDEKYKNFQSEVDDF